MHQRFWQIFLQKVNQVHIGFGSSLLYSPSIFSWFLLASSDYRRNFSLLFFPPSDTPDMNNLAFPQLALSEHARRGRGNWISTNKKIYVAGSTTNNQ